MAGGLARLGVALPAPAPAVAWHGPVMLLGFLATLIGLERAVALRSPWAWAAPALTGAGGVGLAVAGAPALALVLAAGAAVHAAALCAAWARHPSRWLSVQALGGVSLAAGTLLWARGGGVPAALPWWEAWLVLTIVGERLELSRVAAPPPRAMRVAGGLVGLAFLGAAASVWDAGAGARLAGASWLGLALWLARHDLARRSRRRPGLPRFMAWALLSGMAWLAAAGVLALAFGAPGAGPRHDAIRHALLLGFVFSMVFGHAPVVFPAVLGVAIPFRGRFWAHLLLLHAGLLLRGVGDLGGPAALRGWGGLANAAAILLFFASTAAAAAGALPLRARRPGGA